MMNKQQDKLIKEVSRVMQEEGYSQSQLANFAGCSSSMVGMALSGKSNLKEERWRMICENIGLDYDSIVSEEHPPVSAKETDAAAIVQQSKDSCCDTAAGACNVDTIVITDKERKLCGLLGGYLLAKLEADIRIGMEMPITEVYALLRAADQMGCIAKG